MEEVGGRGGGGKPICTVHWCVLHVGLRSFPVWMVVDDDEAKVGLTEIHSPFREEVGEDGQTGGLARTAAAAKNKLS